VVIHQINVESVPILVTKDDPPVTGYRHTPLAPLVASKRVEAIARQIEIGRVKRHVQVSQYVGNPADLIGADPTRIPLLKQAPQAAVPERLYHPKTVPRIDTGINKDMILLCHRSGSGVHTSRRDRGRGNADAWVHPA
jgi:hypothetical protein